MRTLRRALIDPSTYRSLVYLVSGLPLGLVWFVALVTVWSLCLGLLITPFGILVLIGMGFMTRGFAAVEAEIAQGLLGVDAHAPAAPPAGRGFWAWLRGMFGGSFWRAQAYLLVRWFAGFPVGVAVVSLLGIALGLIFAPAWVPFVHHGAHLGFWRPHTFLQAWALVPAGLLLLPLALLVTKPIAAAFRPIAAELLESGSASSPASVAFQPRAGRAHSPRRALVLHAAIAGMALFVLVLIWALTSRGYFWPVWVALPLAGALAIHGWFAVTTHRPSLVRRFRNSRSLARATGIGAVVAVYNICVWAITRHGYFWPVWPMLGIVIILGALTVPVLLASPDQVAMAERIQTLQSTRAGAVNLQDTELRRIERDLHDGAQARLVALGMSLGMAEQQLAEDPQRVGELIAEARAGAETALRELRDLARGIHPPVLADRGLEAALASLAGATPMRVGLSVDLRERPLPALETAAYFVVAEALANATKHAHAQRVDIRIAQVHDVIELRIEDDGSGGADPNGTGLLGMRRRVEALDGTLSVLSPVGGPTTIRAELPCGS